MPLHLHLRELHGRCFTWLSAPGASALSILFIGDVAPVTESPRLTWLIGADGKRIDQVLVCNHRDGVLITCHGGTAVRRRIEDVLREAGLSAGNAQPFGRSRFQRFTLELLSQAHGAAGVGMTIDAAGQDSALSNLRADAVEGLLADSAGTAFLLSPPRVQLWGPVNAGKSSLLNALCGLTLAAVGNEPGLTRDVIEGRLEHDGFALRIFDAPGTWAGGSELDAQAQRLAQHWRGQADLTLTLPGGLDRVAELSGARVPYDVNDVNSVSALKVRLVEHFFGPLRRMPPMRRYALHPELRNDLRTMDLDAVKAKWL